MSDVRPYVLELNKKNILEYCISAGIFTKHAEL